MPRLTVALIGIAAIILVVRRDPGGLIGMTDKDLVQVAALVAIMFFLLGSLLGRPMTPGQIIRGTFVWTIAILLAAGAYASRDEIAGFGGRLLGALAPGLPISGTFAGVGKAGTVIVMRGLDGHFAVRSTVNDESLMMMVDTGASFVTLTANDAARLGFDPDSLRYTVPIQTANGPITAAPIVLDQLAIGSISRDHVNALVAPRGALDQSLLGMSFLDTLNTYAVSGDRMMLTP